MIKLKDLIIETWNSNIWPSALWNSDIWNSDIWPSRIWENETENIPYDYFDRGVVRTRKPIDPNVFQVGKYYSDGDVLRYVMSQHEDFEDDDRITGVFKCAEMNPKDIEESEYHIEWSEVEQLARSDRPYPPIVLNSWGWIIDGGHRLEAAKLRGDKKIKVLIQQ